MKRVKRSSYVFQGMCLFSRNMSRFVAMLTNCGKNEFGLSHGTERESNIQPDPKRNYFWDTRLPRCFGESHVFCSEANFRKRAKQPIFSSSERQIAALNDKLSSYKAEVESERSPTGKKAESVRLLQHQTLK